MMLTNGKASREVGTCEEYLNVVSAGFYPATNYDNKMSATFVHDCFVFRDLQHARAAVSGNSYGWSKDSLAQLPPILVAGARAITDAAEQAEECGESWQQFDPTLKLTDVTRDELEAEDADFAYSLEILARGDFNGDGLADVAVYGCSTGKESTWVQCKYFIFSRTNQGKLVRLTHDVPPYMMKVAAVADAQGQPVRRAKSLVAVWWQPNTSNIYRQLGERSTHIAQMAASFG